MPRLFALLLLVFFFLPASFAGTAADLEALFQKDKLWSGADGAYSILLKNGQVLWLFGDSFIGTIDGGTRKDNEMVHNSIGIQDLNKGSMSFYWSRSTKASSYFADGEKYWLWPGDGIYYEGKVYFFAKRVVATPGEPDDPFGFAWTQDELVCIDNPDDNPDKWQCRHILLPFCSKRFHLGIACFSDDKQLYVLGMNEQTRQAFLSRISLPRLAELDVSAFEFMHKSKSGETSWSRSWQKSTALFDKVATEGSICKTGNKFYCLYQRNSMGAEIVARVAENICGPWSAEKVVYTVPEMQAKRGFCYAAKIHAEQKSPADTATITYAINPGKLEAHAKDPYAYFPHVIEIKLPLTNEPQKSGHN